MLPISLMELTGAFSNMGSENLADVNTRTDAESTITAPMWIVSLPMDRMPIHNRCYWMLFALLVTLLAHSEGQIE